MEYSLHFTMSNVLQGGLFSRWCARRKDPLPYLDVESTANQFSGLWVADTFARVVGTSSRASVLDSVQYLQPRQRPFRFRGRRSFGQYCGFTDSRRMAGLLGLQSAIIYILSVYYRVFARIEYTDGKAKQEVTSWPQTVVEGTNVVSNGVMDNIDRTALDEFQVTSLLKRERYYRDSRQWQKLRNCYHPDPSTTRIEVAA